LLDDETEIDEIYDMVDAVVPRTDDPELPALTFRVILLGTMSTLFLSFVNTFFSFRSANFTISPFIGAILNYFMGKFLEKILPSSPIVTIFKI
jgi:hypothetical protein